MAGRAGLPQLGSPPGIAGIEDTLYESLAERFGIYAGRPEFMHGDPPYPQTGTPVRLVVIDTQPNSFDELDPAGQTASLHGITLMRAASWLLCDSGARPAAVPDFSSCVAEVVGRVALSYRCTTDSDVINPGGDPDSCRLKQEGGYTGSMVELARAVWDEVNDWLDEGATSRLVLNGSLNWDVLYGGDETVVGEMPVPVQAVHAAVQDARCRGALPLFTSGNRVNGPGNLRGPSLPGLWEGRDGSTEAECIAALAPHDLPNPVDFPVDASTYFPLLYAVGGVQADNRPLPGAGSDAEPRLVAMADHAAIPTLENVGIGNALGRHGTLTGPSVATLVVSATTAVAWHYRSDLPAYRLMNAVHGAGLDLGRPADLFPPSARPPPGPAHPAVRDDRLGLPDHRDRGLPPAGEPAGLPAREDVRVPVPRGG